MSSHKRSLSNPLGRERMVARRHTAEPAFPPPRSSSVSKKPPQLPEIDLEPLDFALLRNKRASTAAATINSNHSDAAHYHYGLDLWNVRLSYNVGRRSLLRDKEPSLLSAGGAMPRMPTDLRMMQSSKMREVLGMDSGDEEVDSNRKTHDDDDDDGRGRGTPDSQEEDDEGKPCEKDAHVLAAAAGAGTETTKADVEPEYIHGWRLFSVMLAITLACFLYLLDVSILVTAIPKITSDFHSLQDIGWYGATYNLASASLQPLSGKFYTYFHAKWMFLAFFIIFEIGNLICGTATSSTMMIVGRTIAGAGSSGLTNGSFAIITACAPMEKRPQLMGIMIGVCQMGLVAGPLIGGALTEYTTWRWCFFINLPVGAVTIVCFLATTIPDKRRFMQTPPGRLTWRKMDLPGFALFAPAAVMLLLALEFGGDDRFAWSSPTIIGLFVGGGVQAALFVVWERRAGLAAMIPLPILGKRQVWTACVAGMFMFSTLLGAGYYLPVYFQTVRGLSPLRSGIDMLPAIVSQLVVIVVCGGLVQRVGYYLPFMVVSAVIMAVSNGLVATFDVTTPTLQWAAYQVMLGVGRGMAFQMPVVAIQAHVVPELASVATATMVLFQTFFGSVFLAIINTLFNTRLRAELNTRLPPDGLSADAVMAAGAAKIRSVVPAHGLGAVLESYSRGVNEVFYAIAAISVLMFVFSWGTGWTDIRKKKDVAKGDV